MKKFLLFFIFITSIAAKAQTSVYHPFPDSNAVWINENTHTSPFNQFIYWYCLSGDTVINSTSYHKLSICDSNQVSLSVQGGIRQDTATKKVYFICFNSSFNPETIEPCSGINTEQLLYDFNAGVGDTIFYSVYNTVDIVLSIDSVQLLDGTYRKRYFPWNTSYANDLPIIEGIGSTGQLIWGGYMTGGDDLYQLDCFRQNNNFLYALGSTTFSCLPPTLISVQEINSSFPFLISPNPATTEVTINFGKASRYTVQLSNTLGEVLEQTQTNSSSLSLNLSTRPKGIYFITVKDEQGNKVVRKVVKM